MGEVEPVERQRVLQEVKRNRDALRDAPEELKSDRDIVLAAVSYSGFALQFAAERLKSDRDIVLAAVNTSWLALKFVAQELKSDREIVLAAVYHDGWALESAAEELRQDREVVLAAVTQDAFALNYAAEELLLDGDFARDAKEQCHTLKVSLLSGRYTHIVSLVEDPLSAQDIVGCCCESFGLEYGGTEALVHGDAVVPKRAEVPDWPGIQPPGQISEYQLVVGAVQP